MQIIKQGFHSLFQLPTVAWEPMPACPGLPRDQSPDLSFLSPLNGALSQECLHSCLMCLPALFLVQQEPQSEYAWCRAQQRP